MAEVINMPRLSDTMEEGTLAKWFKKVGDTVKEGEILAEIETDKATMEFESFYDGVLLHIGIDEGSTAPVDSIIAIIGSKGEDISKIINNDTPVAKEEPTPVAKEEPTPVAEEESTPVVKEESTPVAKEEPTPVAEEQVKPVSKISKSNDRILISPLAKKLADEKGIDISAIKGSGDNGRIIKRDIDSFKPSNYSQFSQPRPHLKESSFETQNSTMRKAIAKRLADSKFSAPHYYLNIELEMDNIISFRKQFVQTQNIKISFNDIIAKAVSLSLAKHPKVNSRWYDDKIIFNEHVHLGVAVAVDDGLIVPVVKFSNSKDLPQINAEIKDFAERAKK
jgi:pyruvate dehydrogenase E2 component (dihydrolipoamide acetyltransferase)